MHAALHAPSVSPTPTAYGGLAIAHVREMLRTLGAEVFFVLVFSAAAGTWWGIVMRYGQAWTIATLSLPDRSPTLAWRGNAYVNHPCAVHAVEHDPPDDARHLGSLRASELLQWESHDGHIAVTLPDGVRVVAATAILALRALNARPDDVLAVYAELDSAVRFIGPGYNVCTSTVATRAIPPRHVTAAPCTLADIIDARISTREAAHA